jgi:hypothetical protein
MKSKIQYINFNWKKFKRKIKFLLKKSRNKSLILIKPIFHNKKLFKVNKKTLKTLIIK